MFHNQMNTKRKKNGRPGRWIVLIFFTIILANSPAFSKAPRHALPDYDFQQLSIKDGLSVNSILCILQDKKGFLWLGTSNGLNKYDGKSFTVYQHEPGNPRSLGSSYISSLYLDRDENLWIGTVNGELNRWDAEKDVFTCYTPPPGKPGKLIDMAVTKIVENRKGELLVLYVGIRIDRFDPGNGTFHPFPFKPFKPDGSNGSRKPRVLDIHIDSRERLWLATEHRGIFVYEPGQKQPVNYKHIPGNPNSPSGNSIQRICEDRSGNIWLGVNRFGLNKFAPKTGTFTAYPFKGLDIAKQEALKFFSISPGHRNRLWIGTSNSGLIIFDPREKKYRHYPPQPAIPNRLKGIVINEILHDRSGVTWIGSDYGGLEKVSRYGWKFKLYQRVPGAADSLSSSRISAIFEDSEGILWIGTNDAGLNRFDRKTCRITHYKHDKSNPASLSSDNINAVTEIPRGSLWVGTREHGLNKLDMKTGKFTRFTSTKQTGGAETNSLCSDSITSALAIQPGTLWIGTDGGISILDIPTGQFTNYRHKPGAPGSISQNFIYCLLKDRAGQIWIGTTGGGLNRFNPDTRTFSRFRTTKGTPRWGSRDDILAMDEGHKDNIYLGTPMGLSKFNRSDETFTLYTITHGLPDNFIDGVLAGNDGNIWLSTNKGISRFEPSNLRFTNYGPDAGTQGYEFYSNTQFRSTGGELFFGGINGLNAFYPREIKTNPHKPPIVITGFFLSNSPVTMNSPGSPLKKPITRTREIILPYNQNIFSFQFAALDFNSPASNQYRYKIKGLRDEWINTGNRNRISFTGLEPGDYTLRVAGSNNDGTWNHEGVSIKITITPPYWQTWWFRGLIILCVVILAAVFHRYRIKHLRLQLHTRNQMDAICSKYNISKREREVLDLILKGKSNKDIEDELFISIRTVKAHIYNMYKKVGVQNRLELINFIQKGTN